MSEDLGRKVGQQLRLFGLRQRLEDLIHRLALRISDRAQSVSSNCASHGTGDVCYYEAQSAAGQTANVAPEFARRLLLAVRHTLLPQHLFVRRPELLIGPLRALLLRLPAEERRPIKSRARRAWLRSRNVLLVGVSVAGSRTACAKTEAARELASVVVFVSAGGIAESVVCVVDLLKLTGAGSALGALGGHAVRVVLQGGFLVGFADLGLRCRRGDLEDFVVIWRSCRQRG